MKLFRRKKNQEKKGKKSRGKDVPEMSEEDDPDMYEGVRLPTSKPVRLMNF